MRSRIFELRLRTHVITLFLGMLLCLSGCTETQFLAHVFKNTTPDTKSIGDYKVGNPYKIKGKWYKPKEEFTKVEKGIASWYGPNFHGKLTANGETFDQNQLTAAHRTLQMPSIIRVTNLNNGRSIILRVNDRGPFAHGRVLDVSKRGAEVLGFKKAGTARIKLEVLEQESRYAAKQAKLGRSTAGLEVALNKGQGLPIDDAQQDVFVAQKSAIKAEPAKPIPTTNVDSEILVTDSPTVPVSLSEGEAFVKQVAPVQTQIFVQAGSFSSYGNAARLKTSLARLGQSEISETIINGQKFYRVRIGPLNTVAKADNVIATLAGKGNNNAIIVLQ